MKTFFIAVALILICGVAFAGWTEQQIGSTTYVNDGNGNSGTIQTIGNTQYYNIGGQSGSCQRVGSTTYCN